VNVPEAADAVLLLQLFNTVHAVVTKPATGDVEAERRQNRRAEMAASGATLMLGYVLARLRGKWYPLLFAVIVSATITALYEGTARWPK
jgi:hypothetical protein